MSRPTGLNPRNIPAHGEEPDAGMAMENRMINLRLLQLEAVYTSACAIYDYVEEGSWPPKGIIDTLGAALDNAKMDGEI